MRASNTLLVLSLLTFTLFTRNTPISAQEPQEFKPSIKTEKKELRNNFKEKVRSLKEDLQKKVETLTGQMAKLAGGEVTSISGTTLTVSKDGKNYTVNTDSKTHFQRHFWGKSSLAEFSVGNKVNVFGRFTDEDKTTVQARLVRNLSIMKRHGVFMGDVTAKNSDNFVIDSKQRGEQTVYFNSQTKFVKKNEETMSYADLQTGHRVRVKGVWDKTLNKITDVVQVKDYNLPPKTTVTMTTFPTATPTLTPTPTP